MDVENKYASRGVGGTALGLAIGSLGLQTLNGGLGGILGGGRANCNEDHTVNRYEAAQAARIAELETEVKLRDANIYTDAKITDVYEKLSAKIAAHDAQINAQAVINAQIAANISCMQTSIGTLFSLTKTIIPIDNICPTPAVATTTAG